MVRRTRPSQPKPVGKAARAGEQIGCVEEVEAEVTALAESDAPRQLDPREGYLSETSTQ